MELLLIILMVILLVLFIVYLWNKSHTRENFGGPVKNIRRIPKNDCYGICNQYYNNCMAQYQYNDAGECKRRLDGCISQCNYTDYHRM